MSVEMKLTNHIYLKHPSLRKTTPHSEYQNSLQYMLTTLDPTTQLKISWWFEKNLSATVAEKIKW